MHKLIDRVDLTRLYERYNYLITYDGRNQFVRTVFTLTLCAVASIFIWYNSFISLSFQKTNELAPLEQAQSNKPLSIGDINNTDDIKSVNQGKSAFAQQKGTDEKISDKQVPEEQPVKEIENKIIEVPKASESITPVKQAKDQADKKNMDLVKKTIYKGANTRQVSITFDDGYYQKTVEKILDVLKKEDIKSTFFIIGKVLDDYPEVWKRAIDEGHQICNHTNNHQVLTNMSDSIVEAEIQGWETSARKALGEDYVNRMKKEFPYLRLPGGGGAKSDRILAIAQKNGYLVVGWSLETFSSVINPLKKTHSEQEISNKIEQHIVNRCSNGSIILLHFNQYDSRNIEGIIHGIKNRGYDIQPLSEIIK